LGLALLAYVIVRNWQPPDGSGPGLAEALAKPVQLLPLTLAGLLLAGSVVVTIVRWWVLVGAQGLSFPLSAALRLGMAGYFFNTFLPGSIGGDLVKAVAIAREQSRRTVAVATVLFDRAVGLWGLVWMVALLGGAFWLAGDPTLRDNPRLVALVRTAWVAAAASLAGWLLLGFLPDRRAHRFAGRLGRIPKVGHSLAEFWRAAWMYRRRPKAVALALLLSLVSHAGCVLTFHFAARAFVTAAEADRLPGLVEHGLIVPVGMAIQALFPAPGGVGGGEFGYGKLYALLGRPEAYGVLASLAQRVLSWVIGVAGYLVYLRLKPAPASAPPALPEPAVAGAPLQ
jgi:uncharacterized membrane protein YbhN (UPF0104 family)